MPPESALTAEFHASRGTVRQAIAVLREAGIVATAHGRGTYVVTHGTEAIEGSTERQVLADKHLSTLLDVPIGAVLIEIEHVVRGPAGAKSVVRSIRPVQEPAANPGNAPDSAH